MGNGLTKLVTTQSGSHVVHFFMADIKHELHEAEMGFVRSRDTTSKVNILSAISHVQDSVIFPMPSGQASRERPKLEVRRLAEESNRQAITDQLIGQILAHAPVSAQDQAWPHEAVRNVIEVLASAEVERGISIERVNMRGVYSKGPEEGGDQERALANQSREWAEATTASMRTSAMLLRIAKSWEAYAEREDIEAAQRATRW